MSAPFTPSPLPADWGAVRRIVDALDRRVFEAQENSARIVELHGTIEVLVDLLERWQSLDPNPPWYLDNETNVALDRAKDVMK